MTRLARRGLTLIEIMVAMALQNRMVDEEAIAISGARTYSRTSGLMSPATGSATCLGRGLGLSHLPGARVRAQPPG